MKRPPPITNELLKQARERRGWTQRKLANLLEVDEQTVRSWERGKRFPSIPLRSRLSEIFEKPLEDLGLQPVETKQIPQEPSLPPPSLVTLTFRETSIVAPLPIKADDNRRKMLKHVRARWISGILKNSLYQATLLVLGLQEQPDAVVNPWHLIVQESNLPPSPLPPGTRITQVYNESGGELLILGEPGAGKTTLLLELAQDLLERAEQDEHYPIPVVFNLSSWAEKFQPPLADWLVEELNAKYQVPRPVGQEWISTDQLLLLLDGLDEVVDAQRSLCIDSINRYHKLHHMVPMVICSRESEYRAQENRLSLQRAVVVQPLASQQIHEYLSNAGEALEAVYAVLRTDPILQELVATPLMLNVLTLAYYGKSVEELLPTSSLEAQRTQIFAMYVQRMLARRGAETHYGTDQTISWLTWLARQLEQHSQTEFYLERMQPDWLSSKPHRRYIQCIVRLIFGIEVGINAALFSWLRGGIAKGVFGVGGGLLGELGAGSGNQVLGWMAPGLGGGVEGGGSLGIIIMIVTMLGILLIGVAPIPTISVRAIWHGLVKGFRTGLTVGVIIGVFSAFVFSLSSQLHNSVYRGISTGLFSGLIIGLMTELVVTLRYEQDLFQERRTRREQGDSRSRMRYIDRLFDFFIFSLCAGVSFGAVDALESGGVTPLVVIYGSVVGLLYGITFAFGGGTDLIRGLGTEIKPAEVVAWSWNNVVQNLAENSRKGLIVGGFVMVSIIIVIGCASGLFYGAGYGLRYGLVFGSIIGLLAVVAAILAGIINSGWESDMLTEQQLLRPNQGIQRSIKNAVFTTFIFGPMGGLTSGLVCGLAFGLVGGLAGWPILVVGFIIITSIIFLLSFVLTYGGIASLEHYVLRWYLWRARSIPWNYIRFLDYASERILLRKIGGGYMFVHRLLRDFFTSLSLNEK